MSCSTFGNLFNTDSCTQKISFSPVVYIILFSNLMITLVLGKTETIIIIYLLLCLTCLTLYALYSEKIESYHIKMGFYSIYIYRVFLLLYFIFSEEVNLKIESITIHYIFNGLFCYILERNKLLKIQVFWRILNFVELVLVIFHSVMLLSYTFLLYNITTFIRSYEDMIKSKMDTQVKMISDLNESIEFFSNLIQNVFPGIVVQENNSIVYLSDYLESLFVLNINNNNLLATKSEFKEKNISILDEIFECDSSYREELGSVFQNQFKSNDHFNKKKFILQLKENKNKKFMIHEISNSPKNLTFTLFYDVSEFFKITKKNSKEPNFFEKLAHEIKTPCIAIENLASQLESSIKDEDKHNLIKIYCLTDIIMNQIHEVNELCSDNDNFKNIEHSKINLNELINWSYNILKTLKESDYLKEKIEISVIKIQQNYGFIISDERKLKILLFEILKNAVKYTFRGMINLIIESNSTSVTLKIKDTGKGMSIEQINLFENDKSIIEDSSLKGNDFVKNGCFGFGIKIIKSLAKKLQIKIGVMSNQNGTEISLHFETLKENAALPFSEENQNLTENKDFSHMDTVLYTAKDEPNKILTSLITELKKKNSERIITKHNQSIEFIEEVKQFNDIAHNNVIENDLWSDGFSEENDEDCDVLENFNQNDTLREIHSKLNTIQCNQLEFDANFLKQITKEENKIEFSRDLTVLNQKKTVIHKDPYSLKKKLGFHKTILRHRRSGSYIFNKERSLFNFSKLFNKKISSESLSNKQISSINDSNKQLNSFCKFNNVCQSLVTSSSYELISVQPKTKNDCFDIKSLNLSKQKKIIVVDDDNFCRKSVKNIIKSILIDNEFEIIMACDGIDTLNIVIEDAMNQTNSIAMIISDENMNFINGSESFKLINKMSSNGLIKKPILITLTALQSEESKNYIKQSGSDEILTKPVNVKLVRSIFQKYEIKK